MLFPLVFSLASQAICLAGNHLRECQSHTGQSGFQTVFLLASQAICLADNHLRECQCHTG